MEELQDVAFGLAPLFDEDAQDLPKDILVESGFLMLYVVRNRRIFTSSRKVYRGFLNWN